MKILATLTILLIQSAIAFGMLMIIYMVFVLLDYQGGIDGLVGATLFQPIIGGILSLITIAICLIIGLPIRLIETLKLFWSKYYLSIFGILIGLTCLVFAFNPSMIEKAKVIENNVEIVKDIPSLKLVVAGWFGLSFSILHSFPIIIIELIENLFKILLSK
ncbi:MAG: hypothetical protein JST43_07775 [Bacteroidetes bacterium]|nr:hypothetical protein [Bacteroidota bacterium]MBS1540946.1 hypothetical protein [Bacteroidota bacterium]